VYVGARAGEKIHEDLWGDHESVGATVHPKILRLSRPPVDPDWLDVQLAELERLAEEGDTLEVVAKLGAIVQEQAGAPTPAPTADAAPLEIESRLTRDTNP
jgi:FlaA1/EpsC-like NDP-sugar epimerase